jgi:hypothetical protein
VTFHASLIKTCNHIVDENFVVFWSLLKKPVVTIETGQKQGNGNTLTCIDGDYQRYIKKIAVVNSFYRDLKKRAGTIKEGTVPVPHTAPAVSDDNVLPVQGLSHRGSHSGGGNPLGRLACN